MPMLLVDKFQSQYHPKSPEYWDAPLPAVFNHQPSRHLSAKFDNIIPLMVLLLRRAAVNPAIAMVDTRGGL